MKVKEFLSDPRSRVIVATISTAAILLILVVMLIVNIVTSNKSQIASENNDVAISNPVEVVDDTLAATDKNTAPVDNSNDAGLVTIPDSTTDNLPKTGPESILPLALLAGAATAFLLSRKQQSLAVTRAKE